MPAREKMRLPPALLVVLLPFAAGCLGAFAATTPAPPLPLDPLTDAERERALEIALLDPQVRELLEGERHRVVAASLRIDKVRSFQGERLADVHVYRYVSNDVVWPVVSLTRGAVDAVGVHVFQPILTAAEVAEAQAALLADPQVLAHVGPPEGVRIEAILMGDADACLVARCIEARFLHEDGRVLPARALYDLSGMRLVRAWDGAGVGA